MLGLTEVFFSFRLREAFKKYVWNIPYVSGVGGFEKVIFHKKNKNLEIFPSIKDFFNGKKCFFAKILIFA